MIAQLNLNTRQTYQPFYDEVASGWCVPPNPALTPEQIAGLRKDLQDMLANPACDKFTKGVLDQLGKTNPASAPFSNDALTLFDKQNGFNQLTSAPPFGQAYGTIGGNNAHINIFLPLNNATSHNAAARSMFHELVHNSPGSGGRVIGHPEMAQAAYAVAISQGYKNVPMPPVPGSKDNDFASSLYFEAREFDACRRR